MANCKALTGSAMKELTVKLPRVAQWRTSAANNTVLGKAATLHLGQRTLPKIVNGLTVGTKEPQM